jgi:hypothetical protein
MNKTIIDYNTLLSLNNELDYPLMRYIFGIAIMMKAKDLRDDINKVCINWVENYTNYNYYDSHNSIDFHMKNGEVITMNTNMNSLQASFTDMNRWLIKKEIQEVSDEDEEE